MQEFIEKYFKIGHDASATLIVTLIIFILGYAISAIVYILSRYFNRRSHRKMFINNLLGLNKAIKAQENGFLATLKSMNFEENTFWVYDKVDFFQLSAFREIGYKDSFKSFFYGIENMLPSCTKKNLKRKAFNRAWSIFSNSEFWSNKALNDYYQNLEKYNQFGDKRNTAINGLRIFWEGLFSVDPNVIGEDHRKYLNELSQIIVEYAKIPTKKRVGPYVTNRKLILKIRLLNKKYPTLFFIRQINDKCMEASSAYIDMEYLVRNIKSQCKVYYYSFREFNKTINKVIRILK